MKAPSMAKDLSIDPDLVRQIARLISETDLTEIEVEKGDLRIRVARQVTVAPVMQTIAAPAAAPHGSGAGCRRACGSGCGGQTGGSRCPSRRRALADGWHRLSPAVAGRHGLH